MMNKKIRISILLSTFGICLSGLAGLSEAQAKCINKETLAQHYGNDRNPTRCGGPIDPKKCAGLNEKALQQGIVCDDGIKWLQGQNLCAIGFGGRLVGVCPGGCFEADTLMTILGSDNEFDTIAASQIAPDDQLATLGKDSSLDEPELVVGTVNKVTSGPEESKLFAFGLADGTEISVTSEHPMILSDGSIVRARSVKAGDTFVKFNGQESEVVEISRVKTENDVFNFEMFGDATEDHVIVANDIFVGDLDLQASSERELASIELRAE